MQQKGTLGFAQESYDDKGMWMESQAQQQQSHGFHEDSWNTSNNNNYHHKQQFPGAGMQLMKPSGASAGAGAYYTTDSHSDFSKHHGAGAAKLGGNYGMFHENMSSGGQGYGHGNGNHGYGQMNHGNGKKYPYGAGITTHTPHHQFSNGGGRFNHGGGHNNNMNDYVSEEYEYEAHREEHGGIAKMEEKRYEHHNYGGDLRYANPYGGGGHGYNKNNMGMNMNMMRPHHGYGGNNHKVEWSVKGV